MNEKDLLDKMSLIDIDYVEAAAYPKVYKYQSIKNRRRIKAAVAAAALLCISIGSICFKSQITAIADNLFIKNIILFGDNKVEEKMGAVEINEIAPEAWDVDYNTLDEVEDLLGISLLKSSKTFTSSTPCVDINRSLDGMTISITNYSYYLHNEEAVSVTVSGGVYRKLEDDAYHISYSASFFNKLYSEDECFKGVQQFTANLGNAVFVENYKTAHNLNATIIIDYSRYHAFIYHDNIKYTIVMEAFNGLGDKETFEEYLDTLSY